MRLGPEGGALYRALHFSCDSETAIFQQSAILKSEWSACGPAPTGRLGSFLAVGAEEMPQSRIFCVTHKEAVRDLRHRKANRADSQRTVRISDKSYGLLSDRNHNLAFRSFDGLAESEMRGERTTVGTGDLHTGVRLADGEDHGGSARLTDNDFDGVHPTKKRVPSLRYLAFPTTRCENRSISVQRFCRGQK